MELNSGPAEPFWFGQSPGTVQFSLGSAPSTPRPSRSSPCCHLVQLLFWAGAQRGLLPAGYLVREVALRRVVLQRSCCWKQAVPPQSEKQTCNLIAASKIENFVPQTKQICWNYSYCVRCKYRELFSKSTFSRTKQRELRSTPATRPQAPRQPGSQALPGPCLPARGHRARPRHAPNALPGFLLLALSRRCGLAARGVETPWKKQCRDSAALCPLAQQPSVLHGAVRRELRKIKGWGAKRFIFVCGPACARAAGSACRALVCLPPKGSYSSRIRPL